MAQYAHGKAMNKTQGGTMNVDITEYMRNIRQISESPPCAWSRTNNDPNILKVVE